jgi:flagellar transcriptional activator FlhD
MISAIQTTAPYNSSLPRGPATDLSKEVREVNLSYLLLSQQLLRDDFAAGLYKTGLTEETAQILVGLSPAQLLALANSSTLIVGFRLNDASLLTLLTKNPSGGILQQARAAMALAQSAPMSMQNAVKS